MSYDYSHLNDPSYKLQFTAYAALMNGTAVCQGYANLLYRLLLESGVDARILSGDGVTSSGRGPHAWNIAALGDAYFLMDSTWDRSLYEVSRPYEYLMKGSDKFTDHILESKFLTDAFQERYPISQNDLGLQGDFCYQVKDGKAYLLSYNADAESLTAPSTFGGYPLTGVGKRAFSERQALKTVVFEEGLKDISPEGFFQCQGLTSIALPSTFGDGAQEPAGFAIGCGKLSEVTVPESSANFCTQDGVLYTKNKDSLLLYPAGKAGEAFQIPEGVERIAASAFANAGALKTVHIPKSVRLIGEAVKEPACEMEGERRLPCIACDETKTEPIAALGHDFAAEYTVDKEATCGEEGSKSRHCIRCEAETDVTAIPSVEHLEEVRNQREATCHQYGNTGDRYCALCNERLAEGERIPKTSHLWDAGALTLAPTETMSGTKTFTCTVCFMARTEKVPALGKKEEGGKKEEDDKAEEGGLTQKPSVAVTSFMDPGSKLIFTVKKQGSAVWVAAPVNQKASKIVIPSKVEWKGVTYRVTGISPKAFRKCRRLSSVKISKTVESIGAQAFMGCRKLKDIQISTTKLTGTSVGAKAFQGISKKAQIKAPKKKRAQYRKLLRKKGVGKKATVK